MYSYCFYKPFQPAAVPNVLIKEKEKNEKN